MENQFDYTRAFSRNIGWVTPDEQQALRGKRVAIAGVGGVGGGELLTLVRLGITRFHIADFDTFDVPNFNRQAGAMVSTLNQPKAEVMARMARDINPEVDIRIFPKGVHATNADEFLDGVDLYVDGLDFFAFDAREAVFDACTRLRIPATTAAPLGMGVANLNFLPGRMSFEEYFGWKGQDELGKAVRFLVGLAPAALHRPYLVMPEALNLAERRGPSTIMACQLCAAIVGVQAIKILLKRGDVIAAPRGMHYDGFRDKLVKTWRPGGNRHPWQRFVIAKARRRIEQTLEQS
ncbi:ThiF family adenylyltransferase [Pseudoduganella albidiflava]|uniref:ThiF family adenylyltransferase n=1 Tax=Pseudoduganella albidiflava TaxID=321983 RepID=A0A411X5F9_9BURK|nr:ThiF family adenylyltransferase [Pseudoduganella albidiflava]QBI04239.1 ThiF family adenylyltransferase [Pseudoduganella albidiflava]GGY25724.1 hypothetical protein GCM10007387_04330 [Pseudoduganella albidiflava]